METVRTFFFFMVFNFVIFRCFFSIVVSFCMVSVVAGSYFLFYGFCRWLSYGFRRGRTTISYGFRRRIFNGFCRRRRIQHFRTYRVIPCLGGF